MYCWIMRPLRYYRLHVVSCYNCDIANSACTYMYVYILLEYFVFYVYIILYAFGMDNKPVSLHYYSREVKACGVVIFFTFLLSLFNIYYISANFNIYACTLASVHSILHMYYICIVKSAIYDACVHYNYEISFAIYIHTPLVARTVIHMCTMHI